MTVYEKKKKQELDVLVSAKNLICNYYTLAAFMLKKEDYKSQEYANIKNLTMVLGSYTNDELEAIVTFMNGGTKK
jgi:hypothetical protein